MWPLVSFVTFALCTQIFQVQNVFGQECKFVLENGEEIVDDGRGFILPSIEDTNKPGKVLLVAETSNVVNIIDVFSTTERLYVQPFFGGGHFLLKLSKEFANYEDHEIIKSTSIAVNFQCATGTRKITFIQPIEDTIEHDAGSALNELIAISRGVRRRRRSSCSCSGTCNCSGSCVCSGSAVCSG